MLADNPAGKYYKVPSQYLLCINTRQGVGKVILLEIGDSLFAAEVMPINSVLHYSMVGPVNGFIAVCGCLVVYMLKEI